MGNYLREKKVGDKLLLQGPVGLSSYLGNGVFTHKRNGEKRATKIGLIAGGSGITPVYSILDSIYRAQDTSVDVKMLFSNKTLGDILLRRELDRISADESCTNISIHHTITDHKPNPKQCTWDRLNSMPKGGFMKGLITLEMLREIDFPEPSDETFIY